MDSGLEIERDILQSIKHVAYCRVHGRPGKDVSLTDLVAQAKFFLCKKLRMAWNSEIWDRYSDEEILIEYFAWRFSSEDDSISDDFLKSLGIEESEVLDFADWAENEIEKNEGVGEEVEDLEDEIGLDV